MAPHIIEKKILETLKNLPPYRLDEVLDFAEFLKAKNRKQTKPRKEKRIKLPTFHLGNIEKRAFTGKICMESILTISLIDTNVLVYVNSEDSLYHKISYLFIYGRVPFVIPDKALQIW